MRGAPTLSQISKYTTFSQVQNGMVHVFDDAQRTLLGHRKLVVLLRKLQVKAIELGAEEQFNFGMTKLLSKSLRLKKGVAAADRIAKFCLVFVASVVKAETDAPSRSAQADVYDSVTAELVDTLIRHLLRGIESRFKEVRYRVVQLLAYLVSHITEIDEQLFAALRYSLARRLHDREAIVRIQAVVAMARFQYLDAVSPELPAKATAMLMLVLDHDELPEVRRAALLNVARNKPHAVEALLGRARDVNAINRRLVFSRVSREVLEVNKIDVALRDTLLHWGLNDRDASVKAAASSMLTLYWLPQAKGDIVELLEELLVVDSKAAPLAMAVILLHQHDQVLTMSVPESWWKELTAEKAFFVRCYYDYCVAHDLFDCIEANIPELSRLAYLLQEYFKLRSNILADNAALVEEYTAHKDKLDRFHRLVVTGAVELRELRKRLDKEQQYFAQLRTVAIEARADRLDSAAETLKRAKSSMEEVTQSIAKLTDAVNDAEKAQTHRTAQQEKYIEASFDIEQRYAPFGDQLRDLDFVIEQLLRVIKDQDYADVAGVRRLMPIITSAMTSASLTESNLALCVQTLRKALTDENYFSQLCTEVITDIRDSGLDENDETFMSAASLFDEGDADSNDEEESSHHAENDENEEEDQATESSKRRKVAPAVPPDHLLIQCLTILQLYLEIAEDTSQNSYQLDTLIDTLIRPALTNTGNHKIRMLGYRTLGLFTLIDEGLGASNLKFFGVSASKAHDEDLKILCMQIISDILSTHGIGILDVESEDAVDLLSLARLFYSLLKNYEMPKLQVVVAEGLCKLFLADLLVNFGASEPDNEEDEEVELQESQLLKALVLSYFHPSSADNEELRQTLAFCLPVYNFSHPSHQAKLTAVSGECFYHLFSSDSELSGLENMPSATRVLQQLIYWCDPVNIVNSTDKSNPSHAIQATKLLQVVEQNTPKAVKRAIIQNLAKLTITEHIDPEILTTLRDTTEALIQVVKSRPSAEFNLDVPTDRVLEKFHQHMIELVQTAESLEVNVRSRALSILSQKERQKEDSEEGITELAGLLIGANAEDEDADATPRVDGDIDAMTDDVLQETEDHQDDDQANDNEAHEISPGNGSHQLIDESENTDVPMEQQKIQEPGPSRIADAEVQNDLAEIDRLLDEEEDVYYDIGETEESGSEQV